MAYQTTITMIAHEDCDHQIHMDVFSGIYCYNCGKFLGKNPEDVETQETWHDRPPML